MNTNNDRLNKYTLSLILEQESLLQPKGNSVFDTIVGQVEVIKKLKFFVGSHSVKTPLPTILFTGSQGLGKSFMAAAVAKALGRDLVEINCGTIETAEDFVEGVLINKVAGVTPKTILLDEAHSLSPDVTTNLLTLLNPTATNLNRLAYKSWFIEYDFSKLNVILATTDAHKIFKPLLNRCVEIYFCLYSHKELYAILKNYLPGISIRCNRNELAYACRGRARDAYFLSNNISRYCAMNDTNVFDNEAWNNIKDIFGIHRMGLKTHEVDLLKIVAENEPISLTNLSVKMGLNASNVESEIEVRPRELGLIDNAPRGRILTNRGKAYLKGAA